MSRNKVVAVVALHFTVMYCDIARLTFPYLLVSFDFCRTKKKKKPLTQKVLVERSEIAARTESPNEEAEKPKSTRE